MLRSIVPCCESCVNNEHVYCLNFIFFAAYPDRTVLLCSMNILLTLWVTDCTSYPPALVRNCRVNELIVSTAFMVSAAQAKQVCAHKTCCQIYLTLVWLRSCFRLSLTLLNYGISLARAWPAWAMLAYLRSSLSMPLPHSSHRVSLSRWLVFATSSTFST